MLKKSDYVVMMTGSKASEPITSFLVLGGLTTPSQFFCFFKFFFVFVFFFLDGAGSLTHGSCRFLFLMMFFDFS